jgi:hypothetical protein
MSRIPLQLAILTFITLSYFFITTNHFRPGYFERVDYPDETNYYLAAASQIESEGLRFFLSERSLWNGPLNPLWISFWNSNIAHIKYANITLLALAISFLSFSYRIFAPGIGWLLLYCMLLFFPPILNFGPTLLTEPLYLSLLMGSLAFLLLYRGVGAGVALSGLLLGAATLVRPTTQLLPFCWIILALLFFRRSYGKQLLIHGLSALLVIAPTLLWNGYVFGKLGIANGFGAVLFLGNDFPRRGDEPIYSGVDFDTYQITAPYTHLDTEGDRRLSRAAIEKIRKHPGEFLKLTLEKSFRYIFGSSKAYFFPWDNVKAFIQGTKSRWQVIEGLLWPLMQVVVASGALLTLFRAGLPITLYFLLSGFIAYFIAIHTISFPLPRLSLPMYPYLAVLAVSGFSISSIRQTWLLATISLSLAVLIFLCIKLSEPANSEISPYEATLFDSQQRGSFYESHDMDSSGVITGTDSYVVFNFSQTPSSRGQMVLVPLTIVCPIGFTGSAIGQLFWRSSEQPHFSELARIDFPLSASTGIRLLRPGLHPQWRGDVLALRVDFPESWKGCSIRTEDVAIVR